MRTEGEATRSADPRRPPGRCRRQRARSIHHERDGHRRGRGTGAGGPGRREETFEMRSGSTSKPPVAPLVGGRGDSPLRGQIAFELCPGRIRPFPPRNPFPDLIDSRRTVPRCGHPRPREPLIPRAAVVQPERGRTYTSGPAGFARTKAAAPLNAARIHSSPGSPRCAPRCPRSRRALRPNSAPSRPSRRRWRSRSTAPAATHRCRAPALRWT